MAYCSEFFDLGIKNIISENQAHGLVISAENLDYYKTTMLKGATNAVWLFLLDLWLIMHIPILSEIFLYILSDCCIDCTL